MDSINPFNIFSKKYTPNQIPQKDTNELFDMLSTYSDIIDAFANWMYKTISRKITHQPIIKMSTEQGRARLRTLVTFLLKSFTNIFLADRTYPTVTNKKSAVQLSKQPLFVKTVFRSTKGKLNHLIKYSLQEIIESICSDELYLTPEEKELCKFNTTNNSKHNPLSDVCKLILMPMDGNVVIDVIQTDYKINYDDPDATFKHLKAKFIKQNRRNVIHSLNSYAIIIEHIKMQTNAYLTDICNTNEPFLKKLLGIHNTIADELKDRLRNDNDYLDVEKQYNGTKYTPFVL